jgi:hypothetical protein
MVNIAYLLIDGSISIEKNGSIGKCHTINDPPLEIGILLLPFQRPVKGSPRSGGYGMS